MTASRMDLTRRGLLLGSAAFQTPMRDMLVAHSYIFVQDAQRRKARHVEEVDRICGTVAAAGFRSIEFMSDFFEPDTRTRTIGALHKHGLTVPIVYVGGAMHEAAEASATHTKALAIADAARYAGLAAINTNPSPKPKSAPKTDDELNEQARNLNRLGEALRAKGTKLLYHTHDPEMADNAREWRHVLKNTDPALVSFCMDTHWIFRGGQDPVALLREAGKRTASLHVRNSRNKIWTEAFGEGDVDYTAIASALRSTPYVVVELAYEKGTSASWNLEAALRTSAAYARTVFRL